MNKLFCILAVLVLAFSAHGDTNPVAVVYTAATEIQWKGTSDARYIVQWADTLNDDSAWQGITPMVLGENTTQGVPCALQPGQNYFRVMAVTNEYCNAGHTVLGYWRGTAFSDHYYFNADGTVTGTVYQASFTGTWLPTTETNLVFAIYDRETGGNAHPGGPYLPGPILGEVDGTNMNFVVDGVLWYHYAYRP